MNKQTQKKNTDTKKQNQKKKNLKLSKNLGLVASDDEDDDVETKWEQGGWYGVEAFFYVSY